MHLFKFIFYMTIAQFQKPFLMETMAVLSAITGGASVLENRKARKEQKKLTAQQKKEEEEMRRQEAEEQMSAKRSEYGKSRETMSRARKRGRMSTILGSKDGGYL
jgi:hypothetical protein